MDSVKLQEMFQKFGNILSCKVVTSDDGKSKGYGFVQFESETSAKAAIEKLNGSTDGDKQMYVGFSYLVPHAFVFWYSARKFYLQKWSYRFWDVFFLHRYVGKFVKKSDRAVPSHEAKYTNLYIKNLDTGFSEEVLMEKFAQFGKIVSLAVSKDDNGASRGFGFVNFENPDDAKRAVEALHESQLGIIMNFLEEFIARLSCRIFVV